MPLENSPADAAPTRRSSRPRIAASEALAAELDSSVSVEAPAAAQGSNSRRAARQRFTTAETFVVAAAVAAAAADSDSTDVVAAPAAPAAPETPTASAPADAPAATAADDSAPETTQPERGTDDESADAFETASRAFRTITVEDAPATGSAPQADVASETIAEHVGRRRRPMRKVFALGATVGVMSVAGLLAVGMTLPAEAVAAVNGPQSLAATSLVAASGSAATADKGKDKDEIQAFVTSSDVQNESLARSDSFSTVSLIQVASEEGINYSNEVFTNDPEAAIQWPFKVGVGMSSGYGMRWGRLHEGIDFVPGEGAPIQAVADGVVRIATEQGGAYGVTVYIDHVIDGQVVTSHYSHMQYGSLQVKAGETVKVGDIVGHTGNTGRSYGAHLHFEIIINGSTVDPLPWLRENAGRYSY